MKLTKAIFGGVIAALASSSMAIASCTSYCNQQCEGLVGGEFILCINKCFADNDDCPPPGP
ncbi:hypothetical protein [Hyphobacterium sp.]|uniref:hypothetical protein n=1 Tax=Hyphobacterium sp. TaxID=2004662 RepID=UPI003BAC14C3